MMAQTEDKDYCYSHDGEYYYDDIEDVVDMYECSYADAKIYRGTKKSFTHADFLSAGDIIEQMTDRAYDEAGEYADEYLSEIKRSDINELQQIILEWLDKKASCNFYGVENIEEMTLKDIVEETGTLSVDLK